MAWSDGDLRLAHLDGTGARVAADELVTTGGSEPSLVWNGSSYAVAWTDRTNVYLTILCP